VINILKVKNQLPYNLTKILKTYIMPIKVIKRQQWSKSITEINQKQMAAVDKMHVLKRLNKRGLQSRNSTPHTISSYCLRVDSYCLTVDIYCLTVDSYCLTVDSHCLTVDIYCLRVDYRSITQHNE